MNEWEKETERTNTNIKKNTLSTNIVMWFQLFELYLTFRVEVMTLFLFPFWISLAQNR